VSSTEDKLIESVKANIQRQAGLLPDDYSKDEVATLIIATQMHAQCDALESPLVNHAQARTAFVRMRRHVANQLLDVEDLVRP